MDGCHPWFFRPLPVSFFALGRVTDSSQTPNGGSPYTFAQYSYNLMDELTSMTMPSGRVVTTSYDAFGRPSGLQGAAVCAARGTYIGSAGERLVGIDELQVKPEREKAVVPVYRSLKQ